MMQRHQRVAALAALLLLSVSPTNAARGSILNINPSAVLSSQMCLTDHCAIQYEEADASTLAACTTGCDGYGTIASDNLQMSGADVEFICMFACSSPADELREAEWQVCSEACTIASQLDMMFQAPSSNSSSNSIKSATDFFGTPAASSGDPDERPVQPFGCSPNPCVNGGLCSAEMAPTNGGEEATPFQCWCLSGWGGTFCEVDRNAIADSTTQRPTSSSSRVGQNERCQDVDAAAAELTFGAHADCSSWKMSSDICSVSSNHFSDAKLYCPSTCGFCGAAASTSALPTTVSTALPTTTAPPDPICGDNNLAIAELSLYEFATCEAWITSDPAVCVPGAALSVASSVGHSDAQMYCPLSCGFCEPPITSSTTSTATSSTKTSVTSTTTTSTTTTSTVTTATTTTSTVTTATTTTSTVTTATSTTATVTTATTTTSTVTTATSTTSTVTTATSTTSTATTATSTTTPSTTSTSTVSSTTTTTHSTSTNTIDLFCRTILCGRQCEAPCGWSKLDKTGGADGTCIHGGKTSEVELTFGVCTTVTSSTTTTIPVDDQTCRSFTCGKDCSAPCGWSKADTTTGPEGSCIIGGKTSPEELEMGVCNRTTVSTQTSTSTSTSTSSSPSSTSASNPLRTTPTSSAVLTTTSTLPSSTSLPAVEPTLPGNALPKCDDVSDDPNCHYIDVFMCTHPAIAYAAQVMCPWKCRACNGDIPTTTTLTTTTTVTTSTTTSTTSSSSTQFPLCIDVDEPTVCESIGEGACTYPGIAEAVQTMCPKACNVCRSPLPRDCHGVKDLGGCDQLLKSHCTDRLLGPQVSKHCQLFCGTCPAEPLTTTATTTTTEDSFRIPTCNGNPDPNLCKGITSALCNAPKEAGELLKANCPALCNTCASEEPLCHGVPDAARCGTDTSLCSDPRAGGDARVQCPALCGTCPEDPPTLPPTSTASTTSTEVLYVCNGVRDPDECANDIDLVMCSDWQWGTQISEFCPAMCGVCESGRFSTTAPPTPSVATSSTPVATTCNGFEDPEQCSSYNKAVCEFVAEGLAIAPILLKTCPVLCGTCPDVITSTVPTTTTVVRATGNVDGNVDDCADFGSTRIKLNGREASCSKLKAEGFCEEIDTLPFAFRGEFRDSVWAVCPKSCQACPGDTNGATTTMPCVDNENSGLYINSTLASCVSIKSSGYCTYENLSTMPGTLRDHFWRSIVKQCPMTCNLCGHIFTTEAVPLQTSTAESSTTETATATATATTTSSSTSTMATETTTVTTTSSTTGTTATETTAATTASSTTETSTTETSTTSNTVADTTKTGTTITVTTSSGTTITYTTATDTSTTRTTTSGTSTTETSTTATKTTSTGSYTTATETSTTPEALIIKASPFPIYEGSAKIEVASLHPLGKSGLYRRAQLYVSDFASSGNRRNMGRVLPIAPFAWDYVVSEPDAVVLEEINEAFVVKQVAPSTSGTVTIKLRSKWTGKSGTITFILDDTPLEVVSLSASAVPENIAGPVPISLSATISDGTVIPDLFSAQSCSKCFSLVTASIEPSTSGIFDLQTGILRPGMETSVVSTLTIFAGNGVKTTANFVSNRDPDVGSIDLGHATGLAFPTHTDPNGIIKMPVRINAGSLRLGPLQVEIAYDQIRFEVVTVEAGSSWGTGQLFWTADVPPGTILLGGLQESADVGIAEIAVVTLKQRNPNAAVDPSGFASRIVSAYDADGRALGAPLDPVPTGCTAFPEGDVNEDCVLDILDAWWLNKYHMALLISQGMRSGYAPFTEAFDLNDDGICTFADIAFHLRVLFRQTRFVEPVKSEPSPSSACATRLSVRLSPVGLQNAIGLPRPQVYLVLGGATDTLTGHHVGKPGLELLDSSSGIDISSLSTSQYRGVVVVAEAGRDNIYFADVVAGEGYDLQLGVAVIVNSPSVKCQDANVEPEFFTLAKSDAEMYDFEYQGEYAITLPSQSSMAIATTKVEGVGFNYLARLDVGRREGCDRSENVDTTTPARSQVVTPERLLPNNTSVSFHDDESDRESNVLLVAIVSTLIVVILALIIAVVAVVVRRSRRRMGLGTMKRPIMRQQTHTNNHYHHQPRKMKHLDILPPDMLQQQEWGHASAATISQKPAKRRNQRNQSNLRGGSPLTDLDSLMAPVAVDNNPLPRKTFMAPPSAIKTKPDPLSPLPRPLATVAPHQRVAPKYIPPRPYHDLVGGNSTKRAGLSTVQASLKGPMGFATAWGNRPDRGVGEQRSSSSISASARTVPATTYDEPSVMETRTTGQN